MHGGPAAATPIPPVFCKKSPQTIENKGRELAKEGKEIPRVRKLLKRNGLHDFVVRARPKKLEGQYGGGDTPGGFV